MMSTFKRAIWNAAFVVAGALSTATTANAAVMVYLYESGADVIGSFSGSINVTDLVFQGTSNDATILNPNDGVFASGEEYDFFLGAINVPLSFGDGGPEVPTSRDGDSFGYTLGVLGLPADYASGSFLSGSMTFAGETLDSLGADVGVYNGFLPHDTITLTVGAEPSTVPLPASLPLLFCSWKIAPNTLLHCWRVA